jgi:hypothetical protein
MRGEALVVFRDCARVVGTALRFRFEPRHNLAVPQHVVGDEEPARPEERHQAIERRRIERLVAILKDQIERSRHLRELQPCVADDHADAVGKAGAHEILACLLRPFGVDLQRQQHAAGRQRAGEPDARVADGGADLQNAGRADRRRQHAQQRADLGVDEGKTALDVLPGNVVEDRVAAAIQTGKVLFDRIRNDRAHNGYSKR